MSTSRVTMLPSAGRLMTSLRDIGYDLASAVADLVDNSIDAGATRVSVDVVADAEDSWLRVTDDGLGMTGPQLDEAMRYGTHTDYDPRALGHFGLGLKTASLSQCRRLTVASRANVGGHLQARRWDIDDVVTSDKWELERLRAATVGRRIIDALGRSTGTVVLWERLDRILPRRPTPKMTERVLRTATSEIEQHLAMVFHRFLDGEATDGRSRVHLTINGRDVTAWDPFARDEPHTRMLTPQVVSFEDDDGSRLALEVQPFVLPAQHLFTSTDAHRRAAGPKRWNRQQGFYVYRRDRLIQAGGWNRLRTLDEHAKLARIALDLPLGQEDRFAVDVAKMRVAIPEELRDGLRAIAAGCVAEAQDRYRDHLDHEPHLAVNTRSEVTYEAISVSRDWPAIMAVVEEVLGDDPDLRDSLLIRLANADPDALTATAGTT